MMIPLVSLILSASAAAGGLLGDPVLFDNSSGEFAWTPAYYILQGGPTDEPPATLGPQSLDLTQPPSQLGEPGDPFQLGDDHRVDYLKVVWADPILGAVYSADQIGHELDSRFSIGELVGVETLAGTIGFWLPRAYQIGELVGPSANYTDQVSPLLRVTTSVVGEYLPHGEEVFVGVRFTLRPDDAPATTHYGWIQLVASTVLVDGQPFIERFVPLRWAYQPEPDTPIRVSLEGFELGPWSDEGCALAGVAGPPALSADGTLTAGSRNSLLLDDAAPSAVAGIFVGLTSTPTPFKSGTLKPVPWLKILFTNTNAGGGLTLPFTMPPGVPADTELWVQAAIQDAAAPLGVALSNALRGTTP